MPRQTHLDIALRLSRLTLAKDPVALANLRKDMQPHVDRAVKRTLASIQKAQKSPVATREWALDGLPYTAHFDQILHEMCVAAKVGQSHQLGLALSNAVYRTLVNMRKKGDLFKKAKTAVRKPRNAKALAKKKAKRA